MPLECASQNNSPPSPCGQIPPTNQEETSHDATSQDQTDLDATYGSDVDMQKL